MATASIDEGNAVFSPGRVGDLELMYWVWASSKSQFLSLTMEPGRFDPTYSSELLKHMDKQNEILMEAYRSMLHESQKLQVEEEMLMHKLYEVMSAHGLTKKSDANSNAADNVGALTETNNNEAVTHPSSIETRGQQREVTPFRYTYRRR
ncbi:hypothetical protein Ahy_A10g051090 [Arachis hypogaea]|uniref:Uncharacterized protein n=2 Tax=Arachis TaxID=3817 RepID=A0A445BBI9_ARAHY|nr:hypothetical protein Ahy_A10g051090 [Arachis hypogaea]